MVKVLNESEFSDYIKNEKKPLLVDFWANWCGPCRMQSPIIDELAVELNEKVAFAKVDVDQNEGLAMKLGIGSIPTLMVFFGGELKEKSVGLSSKEELSSMLIKYL